MPPNKDLHGPFGELLRTYLWRDRGGVLHGQMLRHLLFIPGYKEKGMAGRAYFKTKSWQHH